MRTTPQDTPARAEPGPIAEVEPFWDTKAACEYLGISRWTVVRLMDQGMIEYRLVGERKRRRTKKAWLDAYMDRVSLRRP